jgi:hypothetical protein
MSEPSTPPAEPTGADDRPSEASGEPVKTAPPPEAGPTTKPTAPAQPPRPAHPAGAQPAQGPLVPAHPGHPAPYAQMQPWPAVPRGPRPPSVFARRWPGPSGVAGRVVLVGAVATGLTAAASVPLSRPGIGWPIAAVVGAAATAAAARVGTVRMNLDRIGWGIATLVLFGAGALRAAGWLFVLCVLTALVTASLAAVGGRSLFGLVASAVAWPFAVARSLPWTVRGVAALRRSGGGTALRAALAVVVAAVLLLIFGSLLASADEAFATVLGKATPDIDAPSVVRWLFLFGAGTLGLLGLAYLVAAPPDLSGLERPGKPRLRRMDWLVPVIALDVLFAAFVVVQFTVLFGGVDHVLGPDGPDFAEYARRGFWQLLAVTLLTLVVLGVAARWAPRETAADRLLIRVVLGALSVFSLVIVASALYRMHVYEEAYGFTRLRVLVSVCELWLGAIFVMVLAAGVRLRGGWLARAAVASAVAALLGLVALDPDRFIAERNVDRYAESGRIDVWYLSGLSADAVPALDRLPGNLRTCALERINSDLSRQPDDWREWNLARWRAREILAADPPGIPDRTCPYRLP